jgi:hypothetical protein
MSNSNKHSLYAMAILGGGGIALWAGISPFFLLVLACPLMMFFMMRGGMQGGHGERDPSQHGHQGSTSTRPANLDGSHERIDRP